MKEVYIYGLKDPRDGLIRYVGQTRDMEARLAVHLTEGRADGEKTPKGAWISALMTAGLSPQMITLEVATVKTCGDAETKWIDRARGAGSVFNVNKGSRRGVSHKWSILFDPDSAAWLRMEARRCGITVPECIRQMSVDALAAARTARAVNAL